MATEFKPYVWMQSITGSVNYLRYTVHLPAGVSIPPLPNSVTPYDATGTLTLEYITYTTLDTPAQDVEVSYPLEDPFFDNVVVIISNEAKKKEGQGTAQQSEGDTSGGD